MPISDYESYKLDYDYINEMLLELSTIQGGESIGWISLMEKKNMTC